jgi:transcriptional regulator with XRE-family HTH domain
VNELATVGERIAYYRRRRGLTQEVLAGLVGRSAVWLSKIERGERTLDKVSVLLALACVLKISPGDLIGGIELPPNGGDPLEPPRGIHGIRHAVLVDLPPDREAPALAKLRAGAKRAMDLRQAGRYEEVAFLLPELITDGRAAVAEEVPEAPWCLALAYQTAASLAHSLGDGQLSWCAGERAVAAAERSGDALMVAASQRWLGFAALKLGWLDDAGRVCSDAADAIAPTDASAPEGWSLWGALRLTEAVTVARSGDAATPWRLLAGARDAADRVGAGRNDYWSTFGPANTGAHEVAVALEVGNAVEALRIADTVEIDGLPTSTRPAVFLIDVAHAHVLRRDDGAATAVLLEAERYSPEAVRHTVLAHELVRVLLGRERRSRTPGLRGLAERLGAAA